LVTC